PLDEAGAPPTDRTAWAAPEDESFAPVASGVPAPAGTPMPEDTAGSEPDAEDAPVVAGTLRAPWKWEQLLVESAVIGGKDRWSRRLAGLEAEDRARLAPVRGEETARAPRTGVS